ncbi:MAG: hypothetical protein ACE5JV_01400 [Nitrososphaerales archaeon]
MLSLTGHALAQDYTPDSLFVTLFTDGTALIEYRLSSDETLPTITVPLLGTVFEDVLVVDGDDQLVDYRIDGSSLVMDTFGASDVEITYTTADLVNKTGRLWTFSIDSPADISLKLPTDSVIIGLNQIPDSIRTSGNQYLMVMPAGYTEVSYVLGVLGTKEDAGAAISGAEKTISDLKAEGIVLTEAEAKLAEANAAFDRGNYSDAEKLAKDASSTANAAKESAGLVAAAISDAEASIQQAGERGVPVQDARELLNRATLAFRDGDYDDSLILAQQAKAAALGATSQGEDNGQQNLPYMIGGIIGAAAGGAAAAIYMRSRRKSARVAEQAAERLEHVVKERRVIDLDRIFAEKPYLRQEDKDVVSFLAEKGGEAFESELRERFELPKTTVWRLVKRLEREELVEIKKAGGQNLIRIREGFTRSDQGMEGTTTGK